MRLRIRERVTNLGAVEIGAVTFIVLAGIVQAYCVYRLVPELASLNASSGDGLSWRLRLYIGLYNWSLVLVPVVLMVWMGLHIAGRPLPETIRRKTLGAVAAVVATITIVGLYVIGEDSLMQAMRLSNVFAASAQVRERDLSTLSLASGEPDQVIALLGPKVSREDFVTNVRWGAPGQAFLVGEAYRMKGDIAAARRFYLRAQQAADEFDASLTPHMMDKNARWQAQFGTDFDFWSPNAPEMKELSVRVRTVSQQRLDQLSRDDSERMK